MPNPRRSSRTASHERSQGLSSTRTRWIVLAILAAFAALLLLPYFHGYWRLADDAYEFTLPSVRFQERVLALGQWPHWNLNEGFGKPTAVNSNFMYFYPPTPIWGMLVGWTETSQLVFLYLHLVLGACLAFRFSRRIGHSLEAAVFFSLAFIGNGFALGYFACMPLLFPYLYWPLLGEGLLDLKNDERSGAGKVSLALVFIESSGYPLIKLLIYASTGIAAMPLFRKHWRSLGISGLIAILCTAPEWATSLRALPLSDRMGVDIYGDISYGSPTNFLSLGTLLVPTAFLKRDGFQLGMVWLERSWWIGALTLAVIFGAFRNGSLELVKYRRFAWIALGGMLFSMGGHSFFREFSSVAIPILEHIRFANMGRVIPMVLLMVLGATSFNALQTGTSSQPEPKARKRIGNLWIAFIIACTIAAISQVESSAYSNGLYLDPSTDWTMGGLHTAFYLLLAYTVYALRTGLGKNIGWAALLVGIQFLALADVGYAFRHLISKEVRPTTKTNGETFRHASPQPNERSLKQWLDGNDWITWDGNRKVLNAYTVPHHRLMRAVAQDPRTAPLATRLVSCQDNPGATGLQASEPGPHSCVGTQFSIDRYYGNTIELSGTSAQPVWIVAHDFADPDWRAELNGNPVPIQAAFGVFKAVEVPGGQHWRIRFQYDHPWFPALWFVSGLGFVLLAAIAFHPSFRETRA